MMECLGCQQLFSTNEKLIQHICVPCLPSTSTKNREPSFECTKCRKKFFTVQFFKFHVTKNKCSEKVEEETVKSMTNISDAVSNKTCVNCKRVFARTRILENHVSKRICLNEGRQQVSSIEISSFNCVKCQKSFASNQSLQYHMSNNVCNITKKNTDSTNNRKSDSDANHIPQETITLQDLPHQDLEEHNHSTTNVCSKCHKRFASKRGLQYHVNRRVCHFRESKTSSTDDNQSDSNLIQCEPILEGESFINLLENNDSNTNVCTHCQKKFSSKRGLQYHTIHRVCFSGKTVDSNSKNNKKSLIDNKVFVTSNKIPLRDISSQSLNQIQAQPVVSNSTKIIQNQDTEPYEGFRRNYKAHELFEKLFLSDQFGFACSICERLWYNSCLCKIPSHAYELVQNEFSSSENFDVVNAKVCRTCFHHLKKNHIPKYSVTNGFKYPEKPSHLPQLNAISARLISPRVPFLQIRRLRHCNGQFAACGQIINVPVEVETMVKKLPRHLDDDYCINVNLKKRLTHKSSFLSGYVQKKDIKEWLKYLLKSELYIMYNIKVDDAFFTNSANEILSMEEYDLLEDVPIEEFHIAHQQTLLWSEDNYLNLAPGQANVPKSIIFDTHCEELSFPEIYLGQIRKFKEGLNITPFMIASSEIRRKDRRGVKPDHLLYVAMKILRLRVSASLTVAFKFISKDIKLTKAQILNEDYINTCMENNLAFLKTLPNSAYYWAQRKRDLFAILRQKGKPTIFLTISANEIQWPALLSTLRYLTTGQNIDQSEIMDHLNALEKISLVNNDPVTCAINFNHLVQVLLKILSSSSSSPFGQNYVIDYFYRIEFQNRGSPHCHALLWLNNAPKKIFDEDKQKAIELVDKLISVSYKNAPTHISKQKHKHTFSCYKNITRNDPELQVAATSTDVILPCRFDIPFLPMKSTRIIIPMSTTDGRRKEYRQLYKLYQKSLETDTFANIDDFFKFHRINSEEFYESVISAGINRPRVFLKRQPDEAFVNNFNPFILNALNSNMDIQIILDEYSCATYVVEYVNKSDRGISDLQRKIIEIQERNPQFDIVDMTRKLSIDLLNTVEMSAQEAAWFLLLQPMSKSSVKVEYINTVWPIDRQRCRKPLKILENPDMADDSTDIWLQNNIELYEKRPEQYNNYSLAEMISNYKFIASKSVWKKRQHPIVIRYRHYDPHQQTEDFMREMVLLHIPFRSEQNDIIDNHQYIQIFKDRTDDIINRRKEFESDLDLEKTMQICKELCVQDEDEQLLVDILRKQLRDEIDNDPFAEFFNNPNAGINGDLFHAVIGKLSGIVGKRQNIMDKDAFNELMTKTNFLQRGLIMHTISKLRGSTSISDNLQEPIQCFFTGPAGAGKTFTIKLLMEVYNRFGDTDGLCNAYITCATTGRAACAINGTTIHTAFTIGINTTRDNFGLSIEQLHQYRAVFKYIRVIIIDEVSMCSAEMLHAINYRLQQITGVHDKAFGGMDIFLIGDLRQLPPVRATPIYRQAKQRINGLTLWRSLKFYELEDIMRQSDIEFSRLLTAIGDGDILLEDQQHLIESRFVNSDDITRVCPNGIRLYFENHKVEQYNQSVLMGCINIQNIADDTFSGYVSDAQLQHLREKANKLKTSDMNGLPYEVTFVIDKPYMITKNIDVLDGLANGTIGKLKLIEYYKANEKQLQIRRHQTININFNEGGDQDEAEQEYPTDFDNVALPMQQIVSSPTIDTTEYQEIRISENINEDDSILINPLTSSHNAIEKSNKKVSLAEPACRKIKRVWLEFDIDRIGINARLKAAGYMRTNNIAKTWVPIHQMSTTKCLSRVGNMKSIKRKQFPLTSACAITIHKSQGGTFNEVVYNYERKHDQSLVYVALSRATSLQGLYLTNSQNDFVFYHGKRKAKTTSAVQDEFKRLRDHKLLTIQDQIFQKIISANERSLILAVFNCQSLKHNVKNIVTDPIFQRTHIMLLSETWLKNDENVPPIENYSTVSRYRNPKCPLSGGGGVVICVKNTLMNNALLLQPISCGTFESYVGDNCSITYTTADGLILHIVNIYIRPNSTFENIVSFLEQTLMSYSPVIAAQTRSLAHLGSVPLIVAGDFNVDFTSTNGQEIISWFLDSFKLQYSENFNIPTTLNRTFIDAIFFRGLNHFESYVYISNFSYHKPIISIFNL